MFLVETKDQCQAGHRTNKYIRLTTNHKFILKRKSKNIINLKIILTSLPCAFIVKPQNEQVCSTHLGQGIGRKIIRPEKQSQRAEENKKMENVFGSHGRRISIQSHQQALKTKMLAKAFNEGVTSPDYKWKIKSTR